MRLLRRFWTLRKYCCVRTGTWENFCGMLAQLWYRPDRVGPAEPSGLLGRSSAKVWPMFLGTCVSLIWENSWRSSGGMEGKYLVTSDSWVGSVGMEGNVGREMPFSLKNALMLPRHSEV